jgi:hypothetical protein
MLELYAMKVARTVLRGCFVVILNGASTDPKIAWGLFNKSEKLQGKLYFLLPSLAQRNHYHDNLCL